MALVAINARLITETIDRQWHLVGEVTRDRTYRNRLTLTRPVDILSAGIRAAAGRLLPAVQLTDLGGSSANLLGAQVIGSRRLPSSGKAPPGGSKSGGKTGSYRNELERIGITFQKIQANYSGKSGASTDDWWWPP